MNVSIPADRSELAEAKSSARPRRGQLAVCRYVNAAIIILLAIWLLLLPGSIILWNVSDASMRQGGIPRCAFGWHRSLTPRYERWARQRLAAGMANTDTMDISGTEWPVFGSVFYLMATESLQEAWEKDRSLSAAAPSDYARGAVDAASALVIDPNHAGWVKKHWGDDYLHKDNLFYRALIIAALTAREKLLHDGTHIEMLRDQVESLARAIDESPHGLVEDYPGECYPTDVLAAIAYIRRADAVLGTDHSAFAKRAIRAFQGELLDKTGLPPYNVDARTGQLGAISRGCGDSFMLIFLPELWPESADDWYGKYERQFWQHRWTAAGFREFPKDTPRGEWYMDVDSGPVLAGHGFAACAFGVGAARANGRFDHAWPLSAEMLVTCWPLADGTLAGPRILSNAVDAPYLGEAGILFNLTRQPAPGRSIVTGGRLPGFFYIVLGLYLVVGLAVVIGTLRGLRRQRRRMAEYRVPLAKAQFLIWLALLTTATVLLIMSRFTPGLIVLLLALLLPRMRRVKPPALETVPGKQPLRDEPV